MGSGHSGPALIFPIDRHGAKGFNAPRHLGAGGYHGNIPEIVHCNGRRQFLGANRRNIDAIRELRPPAAAALAITHAADRPCVPVEIRPDVRATLAANLADEARLDIR